jgi:predicted short-subunit dehydrogenase-like oxidoreductase (DUF2520 family)
VRISLLGYGKVAKQIELQCKLQAIPIAQIYHRSAEKNNGYFINDLALLDLNTSLIIISTKDDAIAAIAAKINYLDIPIVHTSGTVSSDVLQNFKNYGVWYPLQTFKNNTTVNWENIPICIFSNTSFMKEILLNFSKKFSQKIYYIDDNQRNILHIAAVFGNNFFNQLLSYSEEILALKNIDKSILFPLLQQTLENFKTDNAQNNQTGPAVRNDKDTLHQHISILEQNDKSEIAEIYTFLSKKIQSQHNIFDEK